MHVGGLKRDFDWRASAMDRAMRAGIDDVGLGVLYGLADWRFDTLALMSHIRHLEDRFGVAATPSACRASSPQWVQRWPAVRRRP